MPRDLLTEMSTQTQDLLSKSNKPRDLLAELPQEDNRPLLPKALDFIKSKTAETEQAISQRPSVMKSLIEDPEITSKITATNTPMAMAQAAKAGVERFGKHPLGTTLRTLGGANELIEGIPSDIQQGLIKGKPQQIPSDILKTALGLRPAQRGDILRSVGAPEPVAALGGLAMTLGANAPEQGLGTVVGKAISPVARVAGKMAESAYPTIGEIGHIMTGGVLPKNSMVNALKNPDTLKKAFLAKEGEEAGTKFNTALEKARGNTIDLSKVPENLANSKAKTVRINPTEIPENASRDIPTWKVKNAIEPNDIELSKMSPTEQRKITNWLGQMQGKQKIELPDGRDMYSASNFKQNFGDVEKLKNEIDRDLKKSFYKRLSDQRTIGKPLKASSFEIHAKNIRDELQNAMKEQSPSDVADAIEAVHQHNLNEENAAGFNKDTMSIMRAWPIKAALIAAGLGTGGATLTALPATVPQVWKGGILAGQKVGQALSKHPQLLAPALRSRLTQPKEEE